MIMKSCYIGYRINKPFATLCNLLHLLPSLCVISMYYACKGSWAFYFNYPQINEAGKSDHMDNTFVRVEHGQLLQVSHLTMTIIEATN